MKFKKILTIKGENLYIEAESDNFFSVELELREALKALEAKKMRASVPEAFKPKSQNDFFNMFNINRPENNDR